MNPDTRLTQIRLWDFRGTTFSSVRGLFTSRSLAISADSPVFLGFLCPTGYVDMVGAMGSNPTPAPSTPESLKIKN